MGSPSLPLAELFRASGDPTDERIELRGDLSGVHWIGAGMDRGEIRVVGHAGRHVGSENDRRPDPRRRRRGRLAGRADARRVDSRARTGGHLVGAAYRGSPRA